MMDSHGSTYESNCPSHSVTCRSCSDKTYTAAKRNIK